MAADFKFKPQINANSNRMVSDKPEYKRDFVTRQELLRQEQERQFDAVVERVEAETNQCTFKPSIGNANEVLVHTRPSRLGENEADVVDRLSRQDRKRIERHREEMEQRYYSQFKFKPKLNPHSRVRCPAPDPATRTAAVLTTTVLTTTVLTTTVPAPAECVAANRHCAERGGAH